MTSTFQSRLPFFSVVRVSGADRSEFLHNQLSNDIENLSPGAACWASYNTPKGRVLANFVVINRGDDILLVAAADLCEAIAKRLRMYVLRSKVEIAPLADWAVSGSGPQADATAHIPEQLPTQLPCREEAGVYHITLPNQSVLSVGEAAALPEYDESAALFWQCREIQSGQPWISAATSESCVAQMLNLHLLGAVHFKKGCYPGQEIIARAQYRGQVKRGLVLLGAHGALHNGEDILDDNGESVGIIINQVPQTNGCLALGIIKYDAAALPLHSAHNTALVCKFRFFRQPEEVSAS